MIDSHTEKHLADFLRWEREQRDRGHTLANVRLEISALKDDVKALETRSLRAELRHARQGQRIKRLESKADIETEDTGSHEVEELQRALAEAKAANAENERRRHSEAVWWKRTSIRLVAAAVGTLLLLGVQVAITVALTGRSAAAESTHIERIHP